MSTTLLGPISTLRPYSDASLLLDFDDGNIDPRLVTVRSTEKWVYDETGLLVRVGVNEPALDYDPETGSCLGLYAGEQAANFIWNSRDIGGTGWGVGATYFNRRKAGLAPNGKMEASHYGPTAGNTSFHNNVPIQVINAAPGLYTASVFVKLVGAATAVRFFHFGSSSEHTIGGLWYGLSPQFSPYADGGEFAAMGAGVAQRLPNDWWRLWFPFEKLAATSAMRWRVFPYVGANAMVGDGNSGLLVWNPQLENGRFVTPPIHTLGGSASSAADNISIPAAEWFNKDAGCILLDFTPSGQRPTSSFAATLTGPSTPFNDNYIGLSYQTATSATGTVYWRSGGAGGTFGQTTGTPNTRWKYAFAWQGRECVIYANGVQQGGGTSAVDFPVIDTLSLASRPDGVFRTTNRFHRVGAWRTRPSNAQLAEMTRL